MIPLSDRSIFNMEKRGDFPRRIVLTSRNVAWDLAEVENPQAAGYLKIP